MPRMRVTRASDVIASGWLDKAGIQRVDEGLVRLKLLDDVSLAVNVGGEEV